MKIVRIVRVSMQGVSRPYVCLDENEQVFWCKGNHTGLRAVMSEWVCAKIARAVGLPVPKCAIAKLDPACFQTWCSRNGGDQPVIVTDANPYVFASQNVESAKDVINVAHDLAGEDGRLQAKIYLFDLFIHNSDRTDYNSNLLTNSGVHIIDHNNAFDPAFDHDAFARDHILRSYFKQMPADEVSAFEHVLRDTVTPSFLESVWSEMPDEWLDSGESIFKLSEVREIVLGGFR